MRLVTWLNYLLGRTRAILEIARCEAALWIGLLFALSAGFAREYDGEDLWHEPWHLAVPLVASLSRILALLPDEKDAAATSTPEIRPSETTRTGNAESLRAAD